jgi:ubiquinone/menaquinone biosynthesis C-methylase UbiE
MHLTRRGVVHYYQQREKAEEYERLRFATTGGKLVETREKDIVIRFSETVSPEESILDLGTGTGRIAAAISGSTKVGIDTSTSMLRKAKRGKLDVVCSDLQHLPFRDATFSTAVAIRVFIREKTPLRSFKETARVLKEGGCFIFDTSNKSSIGRFLNRLSKEPKHDTFSRNEIVMMLKASSFKVTQVEPAFMIPRGIYQKTNSDVIRILWKLDRKILKTKLNKIACTFFWRANLT